MANASSKKIAANNAKILANLRIGFLVVNGFYVLWRGIMFWKTFTFSTLLAYSITSGITFYFYNVLKNAGTPNYKADGSIASGGDDLNAEGLTAYMFDIIYITWFVHITTAVISSKFWYTYIVIPVYAGFKLWPFIAPYLKSSGSTEESNEPTGPAKSKRQAKLEERAKKGQNVKYKR
ncbi:hypothetical protein K450DRAFT_234905 [Umbelopsis ramanniana AG]|uniref:DUF788-domain-containing protein n=1 Tax=Umbelopsis ramanniana AG TaxID=1314678 RepID=A0AAD5EBF5_UMBRA|nr:uncharacterized protein K450DRAFT_234905 [Umbelopsis ramanniana AG]KAI8580858.1 hypothetical protein K450DRAFT_234905 [Umbelopsis ramanniana AG]